MSFKFGLTQEYACSYLPEKQEQLLVLMPEQAPNLVEYGYLIAAGFRRSGMQIYRPHCQDCRACEAIRIPVTSFKYSKSQKRIRSRNQDLHIKVSKTNKPEYYPLYENYVNQRHADGSMYPANKEQYQGFIINPWDKALYLELHDENGLIAVAVTDNLPNSLSALYTFFKPDQDKRSLGTFAVLQQIELAKRLNKDYLYLGYQIDACEKMRYKQNFLPHERFFAEKWQLIAKNVG
ncbi:arginyltransferase [Paraglaciecola aquimarina]|uniref:Aspartate/glutamate leucyltransferase n=1 Tax=Paraglaciecola aquimarina TaxID=1235557 RepID=A0ABU3SY27_9ALTE|nr:arginyltransferase [Paraglaciecola aquimarina]MDU0354928.1 arginyltransferase [Paraglaciecola aquimarina]